MARWRRPLTTASASRRSSSTTRILIANPRYPRGCSARRRDLRGWTPVRAQPLAPTEALNVFAQYPLDLSKRTLIRSGCREDQKAFIPGVQSTCAADDRGEVDVALVFVKSDLHLGGPVPPAFAGEVLAEPLQIVSWALGRDEGAAGELHLSSQPALVKGPEAPTKHLLGHRMELGWLDLVTLISQALRDPRRQLQPARARRRRASARRREPGRRRARRSPLVIVIAATRRQHQGKHHHRKDSGHDLP